jgi:hypothetical protein
VCTLRTMCAYVAVIKSDSDVFYATNHYSPPKYYVATIEEDISWARA